MTASAFDLLHAGHMLMLKEAKETCDHLTVCLQRDIADEDMEYRVKEKGQVKNRPVTSMEERRIMLNGCKYVDDVIEYTTEEEFYDILKNGGFDIRIIGEDWRDTKYTGHDLPIKIHFNSRSHSYSTTELKERVYNNYREILQRND